MFGHTRGIYLVCILHKHSDLSSSYCEEVCVEVLSIGMYSKPVRFFSVALTTFIPWCLSLAVLEILLFFSSIFGLFIHYFFVILLYGVTFFLYYKKHKGADPFTVMILA